ncbi:lysine exporter LysO family protein [Moellerella wisconsensis]|uniref:Lysine exporter LysO family protein n=2 Tax=Moellerella wisconsensis TaxID=158849 RepID=A0A9Q8Q3S9_9GAMM|nr:lysine exporter LysO family protein [Moellerella wisconsensis]KLN96123.1 membrane protein [Moellerella wisconsensis]UNH24997.1 lysine exporter LysO family protein [Moellerella wisconsensis]UNH28108.1 lysine exporter LysO family protein [Moellerella wisconsensis]UNH31616.1 lysine exporter LysO family protein [Moellerella wisconsensis]UNH39721.1 lysine exporter LysO family protein [Moellerella wisconsensis]
MYSGLLIILLPLTVGYCLSIKNQKRLEFIHRLLNSMVYVILFLMGITLSLLENLSEHLVSILIYAITFFICIFALNLAALLLLDKIDPWKVPQHKQAKPPSRIKMIFESLQLCGVLLLGFLLGLSGWEFLSYADKGSQVALMLLLFLVGVQLRNSGMSIRQILINRRGTIIALIMAISALAGGIIAAWLLDLPTKMGLAMASGFGWYSLTGIVMTDAYGPVIGSAAFFNDLFRELAAIMLIPIMVNRFRSTALGICGSTSMDFTLPVLQRSGGVAIVPAAIVHGFVLSLVTPILMAFFT